MWIATVGQIPVRRFTIPASASFSSMVRAAPGCANTLKRVPELPQPQEGVSTRSPLMRSITRASVKVKDLRQHLMEAGIGLDGLLHDRRHLQLPAPRVVVLCHPTLEALEVIDLHVGEQVPSFHIYGVVGAAGVPQGTKHLRPDRLVAPAVLCLLAWLHLHHERNSLHGLPQGCGEASASPRRFTLKVQLVDVVGLEDKRGSEQDDTVGVDGVVTESAGGKFLAWVALDLALHKQRRRVVGKAAEVLDIPQRELLAGAVFDEGPHQVRRAEAGPLDLAGLAGLLEDLSGS